MDWIAWARDAGAYVSPMLMGALLWLNLDRNRLIADNARKDTRIEDLSERVLTVATELKMYLFNERKA